MKAPNKFQRDAAAFVEKQSSCLPPEDAYKELVAFVNAFVPSTEPETPNIQVGEWYRTRQGQAAHIERTQDHQRGYDYQWAFVASIYAYPGGMLLRQRVNYTESGRFSTDRMRTEDPNDIVGAF